MRGEFVVVISFTVVGVVDDDDDVDDVDNVDVVAAVGGLIKMCSAVIDDNELFVCLTKGFLFVGAIFIVVGGSYVRRKNKKGRNCRTRIGIEKFLFIPLIRIFLNKKIEINFSLIFYTILHRYSRPLSNFFRN